MFPALMSTVDKGWQMNTSLNFPMCVPLHNNREGSNDRFHNIHGCESCGSRLSASISHWGEAEAGALKGMKGCADRRGAAAATEIPYVLQAAASQPPKHHHRRLLHNPAHRSVVFTQARMPSFLFLFR
eukprot:c20345_g1_i6 orf=2-382(-)